MVEEYIKDVVAVEVLKPRELTINASNYTKEYSFGKYLDREVINNLLANIPSDCPKHSVFFQFLWRTGCRVTEAVSVRKEQINFQDGYIEIRWLKSRKYQKRIIPLQEGLRNILWLYCSPLKHDERLFGFSRQNADKIAKKYGFGHCHVLRHSYAVNFIKQSKGAYAIPLLRKLLGHSRVETTMKYLEVAPVDQKTAISEVRFD